METVRYTHRLRPGVQAEAALMAEWHRCRFLWNEAVHQQRAGKRPTLRRLGKLLTEARAANGWLREGSQAAQKMALRTYMTALQRSFSVGGCGRPNIKSRKRAMPSVEFAGRNFTLRDGRLYVAKTPPIPVVWHRDLPSEPTSVRVYRDSLGHWYASFVVRRETETAPETDGKIGIDWGVRTTATTTDPAYDLPYRGHRKRCAAELAKAQRRMARRRRVGQQSRGYADAKRQAARVHKRAARQAKHDARVWARAVVADHQLIAIEDFKPKFLAKSTMARKAADAAIGITKRELIERAQRAGRTVVIVPPAYTTQTCAECGSRTKTALGVRVFHCDACGHEADRDRNAARVILDTAECNRAGADDVRRPATQPPGDALPVAV